jgi:signal peptidase I
LNWINEGTQENAEYTQPTKTGSSVFKFLFEILQTVILALILYFLIDSVVARVRVENISMLPTLESGEFLLVNKLAYRIGDFQQGDIIVFHYPKNPQDDYIKRIIGLPGDTVTVTQEDVYVNGNKLDEAYISQPPDYDGEWIVPPDSIFVLGDNRNQSSDSHSWGFVPVDDVVGRAIVIYWPLDELKILNSPGIVNAANSE